MRTKQVLIVAAFIAIVCATIAQAEIPIIQADTVFTGFPGGEVSGIVFGPTGETVILMHDAQPVEIDIKTKQIVRKFEAVPNAIEGGGYLLYLKEKGWIVDFIHSSELNGIKNFVGHVFWDVNTGKIVMAKQCQIILSDGIKCYSFFTNNDKKYIGRYDVNTFKMVDSIYLPKDLNGYGSAEWSNYGVIPNSNKVLAGVGRYTLTEQGDKKYYLSELYVVDFDTKKYTKIDVPYDSGQYRSEINNISVSKTGLNIIVTMYISGFDTYSYVYDQNFNFIEKIPSKSIIYNNKTFGFGNIVKFIDDQIFISYMWPEGYEKPFMMFYDSKNKLIRGFCNFYYWQNVDNINNTVVIAQPNGITAIIDVSPISVKEININSKTSVNYIDSNLVINSTVNERVNLEIIDYNGNLIFTQKDLFLHTGLNSLKTTKPLINGIYFCILKTNTNSNSYKFLVGR